MPSYCNRCGYSTLRASRLRRGDLLHAAVLRFPVRCQTCRERYYVSLPYYLKLRKQRPMH